MSAISTLLATAAAIPSPSMKIQNTVPLDDVIKKSKNEIPRELAPLIDQFKEDVSQYLHSIKNKKSIVLATAWLVSDNVIIDLLARYFPRLLQQITIGAVDTLHLFPETYELAGEIRQRYGVQPIIAKPEACEILDHFETIYGHHSKLSDVDFDEKSKIKPLQRIFNDVNKSVLITGRRMDQGNARDHLDIFEKSKQAFNPLSKWNWDQVLMYVDAFGVPYNRKHNTIYRSTSPIKAKERHTSTVNWVSITLPGPYWRYSERELKGDNKFTYVWKSFGDVHTSVPVSIYDSERSGRFVGREQTECGIHTRIATTKSAHGGGELTDLMITDPERREHLTGLAGEQSIELNERQACDFELLANGGFTPLKGFMTEVEYTSVVHNMRLPEGQLFGLPVILDSESRYAVGSFILLTSAEYGDLGVLEVSSVYSPDKDIETIKIYGTSSKSHPSVLHIKDERKPFYLGGRVHAFKLPSRDWVKCLTPTEVRTLISKNDNVPVVAFQCRNPIHRAHVELFRTVQRNTPGSRIIVHPVVGPTKADDFSAKVRVKTYEALNRLLSKENIHFQYLPYNMMVGGPRECLQHMIIRKNYGCTHMIVGRDHAGCKDIETGKDFYGPYDAQDLVRGLQEELNMKALPFMAQVYVPSLNRYMALPEAQEKGLQTANISGTKFRKAIRDNEPIAEWYAYPEVVKILREA